MSSPSIALGRAARFYEAPIGKKAIMAVTGVVLFGFVLVHMLGNLQVFLPADEHGIYPINKYSEALHGLPELLWAARAVLLASVVLHIVSAVQLYRLKSSARPEGYVKSGRKHSTYASRTMYWSGPILFFFIVYHLLHFTTGQVHPRFQFLNVRQNLIYGFQQPLVSLFYVIAMVLLCLHLYHGIWSMVQSLGFNHPRYTPRLQSAAKVFAFLIAAGNISIPAAILAGVIR